MSKRVRIQIGKNKRVAWDTHLDKDLVSRLLHDAMFRLDAEQAQRDVAKLDEGERTYGTTAPGDQS